MSDVLETNTAYAVEYAKRLTRKDVDELNTLLDQLPGSGKRACENRMNCSLMCGQGQDLILAHERRTEKIIGMASLIRIQRLRREEGLIEDLVVDKDHRRLGVGRALLVKTLGLAKTRRLERVRLIGSVKKAGVRRLFAELGLLPCEADTFYFPQ